MVCLRLREGSLLFGRLGSFGLDRFDPSDQPAVLANFARRIEPFRLRLESESEQRLGRIIGGRLQLFVAHLAKFGVGRHLVCPSMIEGQ